MEIINLSFTTDGRTIGVPAEKGNGRFKIAEKKGVMNNLEEYTTLPAHDVRKKAQIERG